MGKILLLGVDECLQSMQDKIFLLVDSLGLFVVWFELLYVGFNVSLFEIVKRVFVFHEICKYYKNHFYILNWKSRLKKNGRINEALFKLPKIKQIRLSEILEMIQNIIFAQPYDLII
jgi:hypothetical protein